MRIRLGLLTVVILGGGCSQGLKRFEPDKVGLITSARQVKAKWLVLGLERIIPLGGLEARWQLDQQLDAYLRAQGVHGTISDQHPIVHGQVHGQLLSGEIGLDYFPWPKRYLGLELGLEGYTADYTIGGGLGPIQVEIDDQLIGGGLNLGLIGEIPLSRDSWWLLRWGAGYHFTETQANQARADLDGWQAYLLFEWKPETKKNRP